MAWSDDAAHRKHVQSRADFSSFHARFLHKVKRKLQELHYRFPPPDQARALHPQNATEIFIDVSRPVALGAAGKESARHRRLIASDD